MSQAIFERDGYFMRSYSETRWAGMMDALQITWEYEPKLVNTRHGWYLPDFYLPKAGLFVEVKGPMPTQVEIEKAVDAGRVTGHAVVIACGDMTLCPPGVGGGRLLVCTAFGILTYSTFEFHAVIRELLGDAAYKRYLRAGIKRPHPGSSLAGDLVREFLIGSMDRGARESQFAAIAETLNNAKSLIHGQLSPVESALSRFTEKLSAREAA